jgi:ribose-phosphate pyrophosphokinase
MLIIGDTQNKELSVLIGQLLDVPVSFPEIFVFPDGERRVRLPDDIAGKDILLLKSTPPPVEHNLFELAFTVSALKHNGANSIHAVIPYLGYSRADHVFRQGEGVPLEVVIRLIEACGVDRIMVVEPHSIKTPEMFRTPTTDVSALEMFRDKILEIENDKNNICIVSPDMGGIRRIKILSELLDGAEYAVIEKERNYETGEVEATRLAEGKVKEICFIVDDMISSGKTIVEAVNTLEKMGAKEIYVMATHPVFSEGSTELLQNSKARKVIVTDTVQVPEEKRFEKLEILSIADLVARNIHK